MQLSIPKTLVALLLLLGACDNAVPLEAASSSGAGSSAPAMMTALAAGAPASATSIAPPPPPAAAPMAASPAAPASGGAGSTAAASGGAAPAPAAGSGAAAPVDAGMQPEAATDSGSSAPAPDELDPADFFPPISTPETRIPSPDNPAECPATAPEDPVGDCLGLPVYVECNYGTYSCVCDWYHWLCFG